MKRMMFAVPAAVAIAAAVAVVPGATARTPAPAPEETVHGCAAGHVPGAVQNQSSRAMRATRAGDAWIWHNRAGWHLRLRHKGSAKFTFTGTITSNDGKPISARAFHLEPKHGDTFTVSADKKMVTFLFNNFGGIDGLDLNMHCSANVTFSLSAAGKLMNPDRIHLGRARIAAFTSPVTIERRK
jgi:hypothetical protein